MKKENVFTGKCAPGCLEGKEGIVINSRHQSTFSGHHEVIPGSWENC